MADKRDYYEVLGVDRKADEETLKKGLRNVKKEYEERLNELKDAGRYEDAASLQDLFGQLRDAAEELDLTGVLERFLPYFYEKTDTLEQYLGEGTGIFLDEPQRILEEAEMPPRNSGTVS